MSERIEVAVTNNDITRKYRFTIQIPYSFVEDANFLEIMGAYQITDPIGWLEALANFIREKQNAQEN
jgi:hypothetical protein